MICFTEDPAKWIVAAKELGFPFVVTLALLYIVAVHILSKKDKSKDTKVLISHLNKMTDAIQQATDRMRDGQLHTTETMRSVAKEIVSDLIRSQERAEERMMESRRDMEERIMKEIDRNRPRRQG